MNTRLEEAAKKLRDADSKIARLEKDLEWVNKRHRELNEEYRLARNERDEAVEAIVLAATEA